MFHGYAFGTLVGGQGHMTAPLALLRVPRKLRLVYIANITTAHITMLCKLMHLKTAHLYSMPVSRKS